MLRFILFLLLFANALNAKTFEGFYVGGALSRNFFYQNVKTDINVLNYHVKAYDTKNNNSFEASLGYGMKFNNNFYTGIEAQVPLLGRKISLSNVSLGDQYSGVLSKTKFVNVFGAHARFGYVFEDKILLYTLLGYNHGRVGREQYYDSWANLDGYKVGAGLEFAFTDNLAAKTEYSYTRFNKKEIHNNGLDFVNQLALHSVKIGLNYYI